MARRYIRDLRSGVGGASPLLRFLALNSALGAAIGVAIASLIMLTNLAGLRDLLVQDGHPYIALMVLYAPFVLTSAGVVTGIAVMRLPWGAPCDMRDSDSDCID